MDETATQPRPSRLAPAQVLGIILTTGGIVIATAGGAAGRAALGGWVLAFGGLALAFRTTSAVVRIGGAFIASLVVIGILGSVLRDGDKPDGPGSADDGPSAAGTRAPASEVPAVSWTLFKADDGLTPLYVQRSRSILVLEDITEAELRGLLRSLYAKLRREVLDAEPSSKKVFVYAYPSEARAKAGDEWIGMIGEVGEGDLPVEPDVEVRVGSATEGPTEAEEAIYEDLQQRLAAAAMRTAELDEDAVMRAVARQHHITVAELEALHIKVLVHRKGR